MKKHSLRVGITVLAAVLAIGAIACGDDNGAGNGGEEPTSTAEQVETPPSDTPAADATSAPATTVQVELRDGPFALNADPASTAAGAVTFEATNAGTIPHNLRVIKTDVDPASLPIDSATFSVDESQVDVVASLTDLSAGSTDTLSADLAAGSYVLICNFPTHYEAGMHAAFAVTE